MAAKVMAYVEPLRVAEVQRMHARRQGPALDLQDEVIVRRQQAERDACPAHLVAGARDLAEEHEVVQVVAEELGRPDGVAVDVEDSGFDIALNAPHANTMPIERRARQWPSHSRHI